MRVRPIVVCPLPFLVRLQRGNPTAPGGLFLRPTMGFWDEGSRMARMCWIKRHGSGPDQTGPRTGPPFFSRSYTIFRPTLVTIRFRPWKKKLLFSPFSLSCLASSFTWRVARRASASCILHLHLDLRLVPFPGRPRSVFSPGYLL